MRFILAFIAALSFGEKVLAESLPTTEEANRFMDLVQTGGALAVSEALRKNPTLATAQGTFGFSAVHVLDYIDFHEVLDLLMKHGADINAQTDEGIALLHFLIDTEFLPAVIKAGGNLEIRDKHGRTPLMVKMNEPESLAMVDGLLRYGANPNARDSSGKSVLDYALTRDDAEYEALLRDAGALD